MRIERTGSWKWPIKLGVENLTFRAVNFQFIDAHRSELVEQGSCVVKYRCIKSFKDHLKRTSFVQQRRMMLSFFMTIHQFLENKIRNILFDPHAQKKIY